MFYLLHSFVPETYETLLENEKLFWQKTKEFLSNHGIYFVDTLPALRACIQKDKQPYNESSDGHPNAIGHRAIAELMLSEIGKNLTEKDSAMSLSK